MTRDLEIYWSPGAEETYLKTIKFIHEQWTVEVAEDFEQLVEEPFSQTSAA